MSYDVFISYRRDGGSALAQVIRNALTEKGYRVFLDVRELRAGRFDEALKKTIEETPDFILLLTPRALDRCSQEGDWVLQEILHAFSTKRNIALIRTEDSPIPRPDQLPPSLASLPSHNCVTYVHEHSDAAIDRLAGMLNARGRVRRSRSARTAALALLALVAAAGLGAWIFTRPDPITSPNPAPAPPSEASRFVGSWVMNPLTADSVTIRMTTRIDRDLSYRGTCTVEEAGQIVFKENVCCYVPTGMPPRIVAGKLLPDSMHTQNVIPPAFWGFLSSGPSGPPPVDPGGYVFRHHAIQEGGFDARWSLDLVIHGQAWKLQLWTGPSGAYRFVATADDSGKYAAQDGRFSIASNTGVVTRGTYQFLDADSYTGTAEPKGKPVIWKRVR
jgi:hypothetical protein